MVHTSGARPDQKSRPMILVGRYYRAAYPWATGEDPFNRRPGVRGEGGRLRYDLFFEPLLTHH